MCGGRDDIERIYSEGIKGEIKTEKMTYSYFRGETKHAVSVELGPVLSHTSRKKLSTPPKRMFGPYSLK